jgi:hypothetical protein
MGAQDALITLQRMSEAQEISDPTLRQQTTAELQRIYREQLLVCVMSEHIKGTKMPNGMLREGGVSDLNPGNSPVINAFENLLRAGGVDTSTLLEDINHIAKLNFTTSPSQASRDYLYNQMVDRERSQRVSNSIGQALSAILDTPVDAGSQAQECSVPLLGSGTYGVKQANMKAALEQLNKIDPEAAKLYKCWFELSNDPKVVEPQAQHDREWSKREAIDDGLMNQIFSQLTTNVTRALLNSSTPSVINAYKALLIQAKLPISLLNNLHNPTLATVVGDVRNILNRIANSNEKNPGVL